MTAHILILCTHNSARSILAEAMLKHWAHRLHKDVFAYSAGSAPSGRINPLALEVLRNASIGASHCRSKSWHEFTGPSAPPLSMVITVCDNAAAETCPVFFSDSGQEPPIKVHWPYPDPSLLEDENARRRAFELTRQALGYRILQLLALPFDTLSKQDLQQAVALISES
ncbi:MAG: arsenate reductase ArsC [Burkholderiales bacterium]|jgi:arsenate reductase